MANKKYDKVFKESIARLSLEEGRTLSSISKEYNIAKSTINGWIKGFSEECMESEEKISPSIYEENKKLKKRAAELEKENAFLKKAAAFFTKEIDN
ncbi:transposase [Clostridium algidicarnis]|uniref:transposase n=1 Tax=Clostridium algidicarnis TaxID=37659 RepID=UPI00162404E9|nr:transposase [Clostridium algidicarnis]MBB6698586.1 transposase [Clostridium algidicarnis]